MESHDFGWAIKKIRDGNDVTRSGWISNDARIHLVDGAHANIGAIMLREGGKAVAPWVPTHEDLLAEDWEVV